MKERWLWAFVHDLIAHPLMAITNWSALSLRFHDYTSHRAWPRETYPLGTTVNVPSTFGDMQLTEVAPNVWKVQHPNVRHAVVLGGDPIQVAEEAEAWFKDLAATHGGKFSPLTKESA